MKKCWGDLTIRDYDGIRFALNSNKTDRDKDIDILAILSGKGVDVIRDMNPSDVSEMMEVAKFLLTPPKDVEAVDFQYGGYNFTADGIGNITYGQLVDVEHTNDSYERLLGCILVPKGHKYQDGYQIDFGGMPYLVVKAYIENFMNGLMDSALHTVKSIRRRARVMKLFHPHTSTAIISLLESIAPLLSCTKFRI